MLITVAAIAAPMLWLALEVKNVRSRQGMMRLLRSHRAEVATYSYTRAEFERIGSYGLSEHQFGARTPAFRKWLGDEAVLFIAFDPDIDANECYRMKELFPEAEVYTSRSGAQVDSTLPNFLLH